MMTRLTDITGTRAIAVLAKTIGPIIEVAQDPAFSKIFSGLNAFADKPENDAGRKLYLLRRAKENLPALIGNHADAWIEILAALDGAEDVEAYAETINVLTFPQKIFQILTDPNMSALFTSAASNPAPSGAASPKPKE